MMGTEYLWLALLWISAMLLVLWLLCQLFPVSKSGAVHRQDPHAARDVR